MNSNKCVRVCVCMQHFTGCTERERARARGKATQARPHQQAIYTKSHAAKRRFENLFKYVYRKAAPRDRAAETLGRGVGQTGG